MAKPAFYSTFLDQLRLSAVRYDEPISALGNEWFIADWTPHSLRNKFQHRSDSRISLCHMVTIQANSQNVVPYLGHEIEWTYFLWMSGKSRRNGKSKMTAYHGDGSYFPCKKKQRVNWTKKEGKILIDLLGALENILPQRLAELMANEAAEKTPGEDSIYGRLPGNIPSDSAFLILPEMYLDLLENIAWEVDLKIEDDTWEVESHANEEAVYGYLVRKKFSMGRFWVVKEDPRPKYLPQGCVLFGTSNDLSTFTVLKDEGRPATDWALFLTALISSDGIEL